MLSEKSILDSLRSYKDIPCPGLNGYVPVPKWLFEDVIRHFEEECEGTKVGIQFEGFYSRSYYCGKCGHKVFLDDDYCGKCGTLLKWPDEPQFKIMRGNLRENNL